jgi:hypothetical protein
MTLKKGQFFCVGGGVCGLCGGVVCLLAGWWCLRPRAVPARFPSRASEVRRCPNHFRRFETSRQVGGARWAHKQERARMAAASTYFGGRRRALRESNLDTQGTTTTTTRDSNDSWAVPLWNQASVEHSSGVYKKQNMWAILTCFLVSLCVCVSVSVSVFGLSLSLSLPLACAGVGE